MFCNKCGQELDSNNVCINPDCPSNQTYFNVSDNEMMSYIGYKNTAYYIDKWNRYKYNEKFTSWNWPAFLFTLVWFLYRKMYAYAAIIFALNFICNGIFTALDLSGIANIVNLVIMIASALLANQLYIKNNIKKINQIKSSIPNISSDNLERTLSANGGITWVPVIIISVIYSLLILLALVAFSAFFTMF